MKKIFLTTAALVMISGAVMAAQSGDHKAKMQEALKAFPPEKAELVKATFKEMREERKANKDKHKAHRDAMKSLLTAPSFDKSAFLAKAKEMTQMHGSKKLVSAERIANLAEQLNQEEREALAEMMPKKGKGKRGAKRD
ncbi:MAG: periplasmic heavy metal sensor [Rickettsiales bacterium]|nr:periplasmic heavy metal sensor [Rickettsiales bacterium]